MQIDAFSLLIEARERITSTTAAIEALRDYWLADTNLLSATIGGGMTGEASRSGAMAVASEAGAHN